MGLGELVAQRQRALLLELALRRIEKAERDNFVPVGFRRRRVRID